MIYDVCVFGGCSLDMMYYAKNGNNFNSTPDELVPGGKASNQAVAASRAGAKVAIITKLGNDDIGKKILDNLQSNGIDTSCVEMVEDLENDTADIYIDPINKDNKINRHTGAILSFNKEMIKKYKEVFLNSKMVLAQTKVAKETSIELINFCYENNIPLIMTPCHPEKLCITEHGNIELLNKIKFITANKKECESIFNTTNIEECVKKYPNKLIITLDRDGIIYCDGENIQHIPAIKIDNVVDSTGAGDTFCGNLAYALAHGYNLSDAIKRSQYASAMKIQVATAQAGMPLKDDLDNYIKNFID